MDRGIDLLTQHAEAEALRFLSARPIHSVIMSSFIRDNGLVSHLHRGKFYSYRDHSGRLEGVALVGHVTLFEVSNDTALFAFARLVRRSDAVDIIMGDEDRVTRFWHHCGTAGSMSHRIGRESLLVRRRTIGEQGSAGTGQKSAGLRLATLADLNVVMTTHARMAFEDLGLVDPIVADPHGFSARCCRRIEQGRVWVLIEDGSLIFKADVVADTPQAIYLEGIYVNPEKRGQGFGLSCLDHLSRNLLRRTESICLLVNERNYRAHTFYRRAGFQFQGHYTTIFLQKRAATS